MEKEEPVRLEDKKFEYKSIIFFFPQEYEVTFFSDTDDFQTAEHFLRE